jgi:hypothetical protein
MRPAFDMGQTKSATRYRVDGMVLFGRAHYRELNLSS